MLQDQILKELEANKENQKIGDEVFAVSIRKSDIEDGLTVKEIAEEMEVASKENLIHTSSNVNFC